jgi:signal transduction histidine kinase
MLPPIAVLMAAAFAHFSQEQAMEAAVGSYVQDLAESVAYRLTNESRVLRFSGLGGEILLPHRIFSWGMSIPGWVAYVNEDGKVILSSPGARDITSVWRRSLPIGAAEKVRDANGGEYTVAVYPVYGHGYVIAAVSWDRLLGNLVRVGRLWPVLIVLLSLGSFFSIRLLWRCLLSPLRGLVDEIDDLRVGADVPRFAQPNDVREIASVRGALTRFAKAAIDRDRLRNGYVRDIVKVQERERLDMAREIHDGPLQDVTALLQNLRMALEEDEEKARERVGRTERMAGAVVRELRGLCDELAPPWVDMGFPDAAAEMAKRMAQNYDVQVAVEVDGECVKRFDLNSESTLFLLRIFQEAVSNAVRHGGATKVLAKMFDDDGTAVFEIRDNGRGFDPSVDHEVLRLSGHRGLANMTERMSLMGGRLDVESAPSQGTCVKCVFGGKKGRQAAA